jgi:probable F420-dependent oxidoreductase
MRFDAILPNINLSHVAGLARRAEEEGFDALWTQETSHDPFLPHTLIAEYTSTLKMGTGIAVAFSRSPMTLAYTAWDLAAQSNGRFMLGLGTQVKAHIERRFGMEWPESVTAKLRDQILAIREIWKTWQAGEKLNYRGEIYRLNLMTPFFSPEPIQHPQIPIYIAGVNKGLAELAGECADGFMVHPFHTVEYLRAELYPLIEKGALSHGRPAENVQKVLTIFCATNDVEKEECRSQIAFYASTPSYKTVLDFHSRTEAAQNLSRLAVRGRWTEMSGLIDDDLLEKVCVLAGSPQELADKIEARYSGVADRFSIYKMYRPDESSELWQTLIRKFNT